MSLDETGVRADEIRWTPLSDPVILEPSPLAAAAADALSLAVADIVGLEARIASLESDNQILRELVSECLACVHTLTGQLERARLAASHRSASE